MRPRDGTREDGAENEILGQAHDTMAQLPVVWDKFRHHSSESLLRLCRSKSIFSNLCHARDPIWPSRCLLRFFAEAEAVFGAHAALGTVIVCFVCSQKHIKRFLLILN